MMRLKQYLVIFSFSLFFAFVYVFYNKNNYYIKNDKDIPEISSLNDVFYTQLYSPQETVRDRIHYILYWTKMFYKEDFYHGLGYAPFKNCEFQNCFRTADRNFKDLEEFSAIVFHGPLYQFETHNKPEERFRHQRYIFASLESPESFSKSLNNFNGFYNWTMTYREDSDIPTPYGHYVESKINFSMPSKQELQERKGLIAWFVSKCEVSSGREQLVKKMKKYINVDVYGKCGNLKCRRDSGDCYNLLEKNYKFYLSFENSYCTDYVTEKLFNIHKVSVIPVVYGRADYKNIAPPHSYINVEDFSSVKDLVDYLQYLDTNYDEYLEYFHWKSRFYVASNFKKYLCDLCKKLNVDAVSKTYSNIDKWWRGEKDNIMCKNNNELPEIILTGD